MNIHEYQAHELFKKFGVPSPRGLVAATPEEAFAAAQELAGQGARTFVVKSQIHAGGRGKGTFKSGFKGGVHVTASPQEARDVAAKMLGQTLVTHQTGPAGRVVNRVYISEAAEIGRELYLAILLDRAASAPVVIASTQGGMDIEAVAAQTPELIFREPVQPLLGLQPFQAIKLAAALGLTGPQLSKGAKLILALYKLFVACDCSLVEVNPLVVTPGGDVLALDAKFNFDDNALYRHPEIVALRDTGEEDPREVEASKFSLNYIGLDGDIACLVNGAGLAMATMDVIKHFGGEPANFLDVGGGASKEQVTSAFKIILGDKNVKGIFVNIFGGIMDCDVIAQGVAAAVRETGLTLPLVVRLEGNNVAAGKKTLAAAAAELPTLIPGDDMADGARKIVAAVKETAQAA